MSQLEATLGRVASLLDGLGVPWCLVGGLAVSARTEPRFTRDVDVAVAADSDRDAERVVLHLQQRGFVPFLVLEHESAGRLATVRLHREASGWREVVDLLFASSGIEAETCAESEFIEVMEGRRLPVARAGHLLAMKVLSRDPRERPQDDVDIAQLVAAMSEAELEVGRQAVALIERRGFARGKSLGQAFDEVLDRFKER